MRRMEHVGSVVAVEGDRAVVQLKPSEDCKPGLGCACCASVSPEPRRLRVRRGELEEGDVVSVSVPAYLGYVGTAAAFGLPAVCFIAGALIGAGFEAGSEAHGMPIIVGAVCGLLAGFGLAMLVERRIADSSAYEVRRVKEGEF
jgi:positive regulator of sigma E activity